MLFVYILSTILIVLVNLSNLWTMSSSYFFTVAFRQLSWCSAWNSISQYCFFTFSFQKYKKVQTRNCSTNILTSFILLTCIAFDDWLVIPVSSFSSAKSLTLLALIANKALFTSNLNKFMIIRIVFWMRKIWNCFAINKN